VLDQSGGSWDLSIESGGLDSSGVSDNGGLNNWGGVDVVDSASIGNSHNNSENDKLVHGEVSFLELTEVKKG